MIDIGDKILSTDEKHIGEVKSICYNRSCGVEGCRGDVLYVVWDDGAISYPCSAGLTYIVKKHKWKVQ